VGNIAFQGNSVRPDCLNPVSRHAGNLHEPAIALEMSVNRELPVVHYGVRLFRLIADAIRRFPA